MASNHSFQIPDLVAIISPLELRTNKNCRFATDTSEKWMTEELSGVFSPKELKVLHATKIGLLAALCFPTCDGTQLRLLVDVMTMIFYSGQRAYTPGSKRMRSLWQDTAFSESVNPPSNGMEILRRQDLLKHVLDPHITRLTKQAPDTWNQRFLKSVQDYRNVQAAVVSKHSENKTPTLEEYFETRRQMYGASMVLDLAELLEIFKLPELQGSNADHLVKLIQAAFDVIGWSLDVVAYQLDHTRGNTYNLIEVLMAQKNLSLQGAMNLSGTMLKEAFTSFREHERLLFDALDPQKSLQIPLIAWMFAREAPSAEEAAATRESVQRFVTAMKDWIVGIVHWAYETELFFGKKGGEIRMFGWVFTE
ncbi:unnamed protein product [Cyclocybe aegerita]|uniref:Terpenoid synthase n=1 Tax=Cyclocybe aegerita TaxID=1973307 RepID=A0A8S0VRQ9_CYCAE|nr:unnamed protein product [Cyclocybe aegerita]